MTTATTTLSAIENESAHEAEKFHAPAEVAVAWDDLFDAYIALNSIAVSLNRIGSYHAQGSDEPPDPTAHQRMLEVMGQYFSPKLLRRLVVARSKLDPYITGDAEDDDRQMDLLEKLCDERSDVWRSPTSKY